MRNGSITQDVALKWCMQVAIALQYLHEQHFIHRDVKPENIFIDENDNAILGDLGLLSVRCNSGSLAGDLRYMARDVLKAAFGAGPNYNTKVDVFSLGLIMAELLTGAKPDIKIEDDIERPVPYQEGVDNSLIDLCSFMIKKDP